MQFDDIIGNEQIKKYFKRVLKEKKLSNTLLFTGIDGIGKFLFAKTLAYNLMSDNPSSKDHKRIEENSHPDLHILKPDGKSDLHSMQNIRSLMKKMHVSPYEAKSNVFIIDDAHRMLEPTFNSLLKTLEEPPLHSYIILITNMENEILPTIVSRCFRVKFSPLSDMEMQNIITKWGKTHEEAKRIAMLSMGSLSRAISISSFVENEDFVDIILKILSKSNMHSYIDFSSHLDMLQSFFEEEKKNQNFNKSIEILFSYINMWYRDLYLLKNKVSYDSLFFLDKVDLLKKQNLSILPQISLLEKLIQIAKDGINRNIKVKSCLENFFIQLNHI